MPLQGVFNADFTSFTAACAQAEASLKAFETDARLVEGAVTRMADSLSGQKIVQQAYLAEAAVREIGGATKLTNDELIRMGAIAQQAIDKLTVMGQAIPPGLQDLADRARGASEEMLRLKDNTETTGNALSQWVGKLDIKGALTDPLGTAKEGVLALAETMGPSGVLVAGIVTTGGALIKLGNDAEAVGQSIGRMGLQFNIPVGAVSDLRFAITAAGGDFQSFGDSMFMFQKRMEDNADAVGKGLEKIGLSLDTLRGMRPDEQFLAVSDALRGTGDETNKAAVAFEIFGRQGREMLPLLLKPLSDLTDESRKLGASWGDDETKAARAFGAELNKMAAETEETWTMLGRDVAPVTNLVVEGFDRMKLAAANVALDAVQGWIDMFHVVTGALGENALADERMNAVLDASTHLYKEAADEGLNYADQTKQVATKMLELGYTQENVAKVTGMTTTAIRELAGELKNAKMAADAYNTAWDHLTQLESQGVPTIANLSQATKDYVVHLQELGAKTVDIQAATGVTIEQQKLIAEGHKAATDAANKYADAWTELNSVGTTYKDTLASMNPVIVEQAEYYLKAGASQAAVREAYQLTEGQVKALEQAVKDYGTTLKEIEKIENSKNQNSADWMKELSKTQREETQKRFEAEGKGIDEITKAEAALRDFKEKQALDTTSYQILKIWEKADAEIAAFKGTKEEAARFSAAVTELAEEEVNAIQYAAEKSVDTMAAHSLAAVTQVAAKMQSLVGGIKMPGTTEETAFGQTYLVTSSGQRIPIGPHGELPDNFDDLMMGRSQIASGYNTQQRIGSGYYSFAEGGVGDFGAGTLAMLHGKEAIVPLDNGPGIGVTQNVTIHVNGTAADVARQVAAELMRTLRAGQQLTLR